jgi:hypothetical protein
MGTAASKYLVSAFAQAARLQVNAQPHLADSISLLCVRNRIYSVEKLALEVTPLS